MKFPRSFLQAAEAASQKHPEDVAEAARVALEAIRGLPEFGDCVDLLVEEAVTLMVYNARQYKNKRIKTAAGHYAKKGVRKVSTAESEALAQAYDEVFEYCIGGRTLGSILGKEIPDLEKTQRLEAGGYLYNADLLLTLRPLVPPNKTVKQAVPRERMKRIFRELEEKKAES